MTVEYDCKGCGRHIFACAEDEVPADRLCGGCRILGPGRSKALQDYTDGAISHEEFKRRYEAAEGNAKC